MAQRFGHRTSATHPAVLNALDPARALGFVLHAPPGVSFGVLGAVFLAVTGGEAMYADMGHFGSFPIRLAWFAVALPALVLILGSPILPRTLSPFPPARSAGAGARSS